VLTTNWTKEIYTDTSLAPLHKYLCYSVATDRQIQKQNELVLLSASMQASVVTILSYEISLTPSFPEAILRSQTRSVTLKELANIVWDGQTGVVERLGTNRTNKIA
jgi:hypothetical protein